MKSGFHFVASCAEIPIRAVITVGSTPTVLLPSDWLAVLWQVRIPKSQEIILGRLTILATLVHPQDLVSTVPNWSQAASMLD